MNENMSQGFQVQHSCTVYILYVIHFIKTIFFKSNVYMAHFYPETNSYLM